MNGFFKGLADASKSVGQGIVAVGKVAAVVLDAAIAADAAEAKVDAAIGKLLMQQTELLRHKAQCLTCDSISQFIPGPCVVLLFHCRETQNAIVDYLRLKEEHPQIVRRVRAKLDKSDRERIDLLGLINLMGG